MEHVRFGRTGLLVSRLCLGTMTFGYQCDDETSFAILGPHTVALADAEGLPAHARSAAIRLTKQG